MNNVTETIADATDEPECRAQCQRARGIIPRALWLAYVFILVPIIRDDRPPAPWLPFGLTALVRLRVIANQAAGHPHGTRSPAGCSGLEEVTALLPLFFLRSNTNSNH